MRIFRLLAITAAVFALATVAVAGPVPVGQVTVNYLPNGTVNQGTVSGYFQMDANGNLGAYDFLTTASADCCSFSAGFPGWEYTSGVAGQTASVFTFTSGALAGDQEISLTNPHSFAGGSGGHLVIHFFCGGIASCLTNNLAVNNSFEVSFAEIGDPDGSPFRSTGNVFMHITDDPGTNSLNLDATLAPDTTLIGGTGNNGGGGGTTAPEPASLIMLGGGLLGLPLFRRKLRN